MKITMAHITLAPPTFVLCLEAGVFVSNVEVMLEDGSRHEAFEFFSDEITFQSDEFIGLTLPEALALKQAKDNAYLQS